MEKKREGDSAEDCTLCFNSWEIFLQNHWNQGITSVLPRE